MKKGLILTVAMAIFIYILESSGIAGVNDFKPVLSAGYKSNEYFLSWTKLPYPAYYEIEVLNSPPDSDNRSVPSSQKIVKYRTWQNTVTVDQNFPFRTYWRVSAQGLFRHPLGSYSNTINMAQIMGITAEDFHNVKPETTSKYPRNHPADPMPILTWKVVPGAVFYEFELLDRPPKSPNGTEPSPDHVFITREVFTNGYNIDFTRYGGNLYYWRVRALDYDGNPLGVFSDAAPVYIDYSLRKPLKPISNVVFNAKGMATPLYPVYSWIPVAGAVNYEVEITNAEPENPDSTDPSQFRIWSKEADNSTDCYDSEPRISPGTYYWRVRGLDKNGQPVGVYSDAQQFVVDLSKGNYSATFGDSITHGGGAISYSPSDWEYDFQTYLTFPTINLGKSGDTSETMAERFDRDVLPFHPKYLLILGGTNSLRGGIPGSQVIKDLATIRDKCLLYGIRPIFMTLPPINPPAIDRAFSEETTPNWRENFDQVNNFIRRQQYFIDLDPYLCDTNRELPDYYAIDGLHPDIEGKKLIAQIVNAHWARVTR